MDFSQLLDTSTPFDKNKLAILDTVVDTLYGSHTTINDVRKYYFYLTFFFIFQNILFFIIETNCK